MKIDIRDLLDSYIDEGEINMAIRTEDVDMEKIRRNTMNWIKSQEIEINARKKKRRIAVAAAAAAVLLFGSISASAVIKGIRVNTDLNSDVSTTSTDVDDTCSSPKAEVIVPATSSDMAEWLGFRIGYLPEMDIENADDTITPLAPDVNLEGTDNGPQYYAKIGKGGAGLINPEGNYSLAEFYKDAYSYFYRGGEEGIYCIDIKSLNAVENKFYLESQCEVVKETSIDGAEVVYMTADLTQFGETTPQRSTLYYILVFDETNNAFVNVSSTFGFEEVEKIIDGMEIVHTGSMHSSEIYGGEGMLTGYGVG